MLPKSIKTSNANIPLAMSLLCANYASQRLFPFLCNILVGLYTSRLVALRVWRKPVKITRVIGICSRGLAERPMAKQRRMLAQRLTLLSLPTKKVAELLCHDCSDQWLLLVAERRAALGHALLAAAKTAAHAGALQTAVAKTAPAEARVH
ncbi:hypothetical protein BD289DRAFT_425120 [Coniella lustricola]|uniref:Uncharacterized protein n=1 Tax=Coniella lustricola TaxID=2025994 RepID=A0A2T3AHM7_9PEZI|nr:hypothetical protein BD289DRAFT_425120 [Coniella lustricola]